MMHKRLQTLSFSILGAFGCALLVGCAEELVEDSAAVATASTSNSAPSATNDAVIISEAADFEGIDVLANDTDADGDALQLTSVSASIGTVEINPDGTLYFDPPSSEPFEGATITYTVSDGQSETTANLELSVQVPVSLSWQLPSFRADGSFLTSNELSGFEISYRRLDRSQFETERIEDATASEADIELNAFGEYEFRMAAVDQNGLHSDYSDPVPFSVGF